jgi:hypothetical protein
MPAIRPMMSPRGHSLLRTFRSAFEALADHAKAYPAESADIAAACAAHIRSSAPMAILDTGPVARLEPIEPDVEDIGRSLNDGARYSVRRQDELVLLTVVDALGDDVCVALAPVQVVRLRADLASVAGGEP